MRIHPLLLNAFAALRPAPGAHAQRTPTSSTPEELASLLKAQSAVYARAIQQGGNRAE